MSGDKFICPCTWSHGTHCLFSSCSLSLLINTLFKQQDMRIVVPYLCCLINLPTQSSTAPATQGTCTSDLFPLQSSFEKSTHPEEHIRIMLCAIYLFVERNSGISWIPNYSNMTEVKRKEMRGEFTKYSWKYIRKYTF